MKELKEKLLSMLDGANNVVFLGIGEEKMSDDGFGPYIISELLELSNDRFLFINANIDPMTRVEDIVEFEPSHLVLIDTCTFNDEPGTIAILERENMCDYIPISSHTIPIHIVIDLIVQKLPNLSVFMIGIVPESLEGFSELKLYKDEQFSIEDKNECLDLPFFDFQLTEKVKLVADQLIELIKEIIIEI